MISADTVRFRPLIWLAPLFLLLSAVFSAFWYFAQNVSVPVELSCQRQSGHTSCQVATPYWPRPELVQLSEQDLAGASFAVVPLAQDHSYKKVELHGDKSTQVLADFNDDVLPAQVEQVDVFLHDSSPGQISRKIVAPSIDRSTLRVVLLLSLAMFAGGLHTLGRQTSFTVTGGQLVSRARRWPLAAVVRTISVSEIAQINAVNRIPDHLAATVASLPWRNVYRASALAVRLQNGEEKLISDWSKRGHALHERVAGAVREQLAVNNSPG